MAVCSETHMAVCQENLLLRERVAELEALVPPQEHGANRYGLDMAYFRNLFNRELNRPLVDFTPSELARVLARAARTADPAVLQEPEFQVIPEGCAVVPIKPTAEMKAACRVAGKTRVWADMMAARPGVSDGDKAGGE